MDGLKFDRCHVVLHRERAPTREFGGNVYDTGNVGRGCDYPENQGHADAHSRVPEEDQLDGG